MKGREREREKGREKREKMTIDICFSFELLDNSLPFFPFFLVLKSSIPSRRVQPEKSKKQNK